jgi:alanine racemase
VLRGLAPRGTRVEPVVKADAYGHGSVPVASTLEAAGADGFGVATLDEALELRAAGVMRPILVLYPAPPDAGPVAARAGIALTLGDVDLLERTLAAVPVDASPALEVHLEIETGLGRGGFGREAAVRAAGRVREHGGLRLIGAWSHLGAADDDARSSRQRAAFEAARHDLDAAGVNVPRWHLAATGGLLAESAAPYDAVRVGLGLYGLVPEGLPIADGRAAAAGALAPVLSLHARPVRVADLAQGSGVSYGPSFVTARPSRIATLPVGYADGVRRLISNRAVALVRGVRVPLVGAVAMDAVMADVTDVAGPEVTVDDEFVLIGEQGGDAIGAVEVAHHGTTISWEVLAGMARRLPRVYYAGAVPVGLRTLTEERGRWQSEPERDAAHRP